jgi:hypothetical protein
MSAEKDPYRKICKYKFCRKEFTAKRTNQEFCDKDHYRKHNNGKAKVIRDATKITDYTFHQNWLILSRLYSKGKREIDALTLEKEGYEISAFTDRSKVDGTLKYALFCYDFGLEMIDDKNYKIIKYEH